MKQENQHLVGSNTNALANVSRNQLRLNYEYKLNENWNIRTRAELSLFEKEMSPYSDGYLFYQDLFWKGITKLQFNTRFVYFNTTNYDSRIYAYENDVLYASSFPVYYDKGFRSYLNIRWLASRRLNFWLRYACTYYPNRQSIGAGLEEIQGKIRSDIKIQLRWEW